MVAGPNWQGQQPVKMDRLLRSETHIAYALYRTQLFDEKDLAQVKKIQKGYKVETLSHYVKQKAPPAAPKIAWPKPTPTMSDTPDLFRYLNFMLAFAPAQDAEFARFKKDKVDTHEVTSGDFYGTRDHLKGNYLYRYTGANLGIFGNSAEEANYIGYFVDKDGKPLDASKHDYTLHFDKGALPPADAFWSLTMYDSKNKLLVANPLNRYLINSRMLPDLKPDADGGLTLYLQNSAPAKDLQSNWLPAPEGPFYGVLRLYLPQPEVASGQWKMPRLNPVPAKP
jgi:hypothetical protein